MFKLENICVSSGKNPPCMKKIALFALLFVTVLMFQNCKKSSTDTTDPTTTTLMQASVNSVAWVPDTVSATITYNAAAKTKVLSITGTKSQKQITMVVTVNGATNTNDFGITSYTVGSDLNPLLSYAVQQKDTNGNYVFVVQGSADQAGGTLSLTGLDAANKKITGTFNFTTRKITYDDKGNVVSVSAATISGGTFTSLPYTFISN